MQQPLILKSKNRPLPLTITKLTHLQQQLPPITSKQTNIVKPRPPRIKLKIEKFTDLSEGRQLQHQPGN